MGLDFVGGGKGVREAICEFRAMNGTARKRKQDKRLAHFFVHTWPNEYKRGVGNWWRKSELMMNYLQPREKMCTKEMEARGICTIFTHPLMNPFLVIFGIFFAFLFIIIPFWASFKWIGKMDGWWGGIEVFNRNWP
jgi:hypothetical protein